MVDNAGNRYKKKVLALGSTVVSCKDASINVKTSRTTTTTRGLLGLLSHYAPPRSAMTILILSGLVKILHDDKCVLYAITLVCAAHTPRRTPETWARGATLTCSDKKHAHSLEGREKMRKTAAARGAAAFGPTIYRSQRNHSTRMSNEGVQEFPMRSFS